MCVHRAVLTVIVVVAAWNRTLLLWAHRPPGSRVPRRWVAVACSLLVALWWVLVFLYWRLSNRSGLCRPPARLTIRAPRPGGTL